MKMLRSAPCFSHPSSFPWLSLRDGLGPVSPSFMVPALPLPLTRMQFWGLPTFTWLTSIDTCRLQPGKSPMSFWMKNKHNQRRTFWLFSRTHLFFSYKNRQLRILQLLRLYLILGIDFSSHLASIASICWSRGRMLPNRNEGYWAFEPGHRTLRMSDLRCWFSFLLGAYNPLPDLPIRTEN